MEAMLDDHSGFPALHARHMTCFRPLFNVRGLVSYIFETGLQLVVSVGAPAGSAQKEVNYFFSSVRCSLATCFLSRKGCNHNTIR